MGRQTDRKTREGQTYSVKWNSFFSTDAILTSPMTEVFTSPVKSVEGTRQVKGLSCMFWYWFWFVVRPGT